VPEFRYLIIGGGMTADAACRGIRDHDADGSIGLVGAEPYAPYARPPLSKGLWQGKDEATVWRGTAELGVELVLGRRIVELDVDDRRAVDDVGEAYRYERLLLATGGRPRRLAPGPDDVVYYRTLDDYRRLRAAATDGTRVVVIGGGFIGSEIAAALSWSGCAVTMVFPEQGIGARLFPAELAEFVTGYYREKGVDVRPGELVEEIADGVVRLGGGTSVEADAIVAGLGIVPATELAEAAGLPVDDGVVVDELGRAGGRDDEFAAGDVARFPAVSLGTLARVEHEDHANSHGRAVGANMAGANAPYTHLPFFYSDLFELGYEAVGEVDSRLETIAEWTDPNRKGVVCYVDGERRPRGFLLWDVWGKVADARALIAAGAPLEQAHLTALVG
jgi:3-phenylpropionate/trans-cinnamate dioxygenase ferredoxin reductase component